MTEPKKLKDKDACELFFCNYPLKFKVASKLSGDHQLEATNLSKKESIAAAIERYKKNQRITASSWVVLESSDIINKAKHADKVAIIFGGKQQLAVNVSVTQRTVGITRLTVKEKQRYKSIEVKIGRDIHYLNCISEEKNTKISIVGPWDPLSGEVSLYHYEAKKISQGDKMLDKYLEWVCDEKGKPIRPAAKR